MGQLLSVGLLHTYQHQVTPRGHHKSQIISSHPSVFATIFLLMRPQPWTVLSSLHTLQQRVHSRQWVWLCEVWRSGYLRLRIRRSQFREESQSASEPPFLSNKTGKPGEATGGGWWCWWPGWWLVCWPRSCENVPNISQSSRWRRGQGV